MITALVIAYEVVAVGVVVLVGWLAYRHNARVLQRLKESVLADIRAAGESPPMPTRESVGVTTTEETESGSVLPETALRLTVRTHPESDREAFAEHVARLIDMANRCEESLGGAGLEFDERGSRETSEWLELRLVARDPDGAAERLQAVAETLTARKQRAHRSEAARPKSDLLATISRALRDGTDSLQAVEVLP